MGAEGRKKMHWKILIWAIATAISASLFGFFGHTWLMTAIGSLIPTGVMAMFYGAVHGEFLGVELVGRLLGAAFMCLFEAMG